MTGAQDLFPEPGVEKKLDLLERFRALERRIQRARGDSETKDAEDMMMLELLKHRMSLFKVCSAAQKWFRSPSNPESIVEARDALTAAVIEHLE